MKNRVGDIYSLRSADDKHLLATPKTKSKMLGDRALYHAAPTVWKSLPLEIRPKPSIQVFKKRLKLLSYFIDIMNYFLFLHCNELYLNLILFLVCIVKRS